MTAKDKVDTITKIFACVSCGVYEIPEAKLALFKVLEEEIEKLTTHGFYGSDNYKYVLKSEVRQMLERMLK